MRSILPIEENPALHKKSRALESEEVNSPWLMKLIADMKKLLAKEEFGVALAAVQVGEPVRLFIASGRALARGARNAPDEKNSDKQERKQDELQAKNYKLQADLVFINPTMVKMSRGRTNKHEGCLSIRGKWGEVPRAEKVTLRYSDEQGKQQERGASGFLAHIFQHEMDHLEGVLYIDKAVTLHDDAEKDGKDR